jgi:hypothetical protein
MRAILFRLICRILLASTACLPFHAQAEMVGTQQAISAGQATVDVAAARKALAGLLEARGLASGQAHERLAALTDAEALLLAGRLDRLPSGADGGSSLVALMLIAFLVYLVFREAILDGVR